MSAVDELIAFLRAQLDEDERVALEAVDRLRCSCHADADPGQWVCNAGQILRVSLRPDHDLGTSGMERPVANHIARWDPKRVLAEVEAKRGIIALHHPVDPCDAHDATQETIACDTLLALAQPYAGRPAWREEWSA